jgi:hypothetical protein
MNKAIVAAAFAAALIPVSGHAGLKAVQPLPGYACMSLRGFDPSWTFAQLPRIVDRPSSSGQTLALASPIVITKTPLHVENGYAEVLALSGQRGWLQRAWLEPYHSVSNPNAHCTPSLMSNGRPGIG